MINLLPTTAIASTNLAKIKHGVMTSTTVVLVIYIVGLAAVRGRAWYLDNRNKAVNSQIAQLTDQVNKLATVEAIMRQQEDRINLIQQARVNRVSVTNAAGLVQTGLNISHWLYSPPLSQAVTAIDPSSQTLENYANSLIGKFKTVNIASLTYHPPQDWELILKLEPGGQK